MSEISKRIVVIKTNLKQEMPSEKPLIIYNKTWSKVQFKARIHSTS